MDVSDDVERAVLTFAVVPERLPLNNCGIYLFDLGQDEDVAKSFALQAAQ